MSLYKRSGSPRYWCRFTLGGRSIRQSTGTEDRKEAEDYEHRLQGRIWRETRLGERTGTWNQAVKKWNDERMARASTQHRDKEITDWFSLAIGRLPLSSINSDAIDSAKKRLIQDRAPATANRYLAVMRAILRAAVYWGWLQHAPRIQMFPLSETEPRFITREQFARLLAELPPHMKPVAEFAVLTGLRTRQHSGAGLEPRRPGACTRLDTGPVDQGRSRHRDRAVGGCRERIEGDQADGGPGARVPLRGSASD